VDARGRVAAGAAAVLLAGPAALSFASGGYFAEARLVAGFAACALVVVAAWAAPAVLPRSRAGRVAVAGLAGLALLALVSRGWAPVVGTANADAERLALYLAALVAAAALLRGRPARWAEPALLAGIVVTAGYGLSERLVPGIVELAALPVANGRLAQPLSYWNAMGALTAFGLTLAARVAGDAARPDAVRRAAAAAAAPLGAALLLTVSRGAIAAAVIGLVVVVGLVPVRAQVRAAGVVVAVAALAGAVALALPAVRTLEGARAGQGLLLGAALVALAVAAVVLAVPRGARPVADAVGAAARRRRPPWLLAAVVAGAFGLVLAAAALEGDPGAGPDAGAARLGSTESNRYAYWRVALRGFAEAPVTGHGAGSFSVLWLEDRPVREGVLDAHSLPFETAAELGLAGLLLLGALYGGVAVCGIEAARRRAGLVAGPVAVLVAWAAHSAIDWDWEMPALSLVAVLLAGLVLAAADPTDAPPAG
jgi:hypothetical protein